VRYQRATVASDADIAGADSDFPRSEFMEVAQQSPKVYLAGPGVFRPDSVTFGEALKQKCQRAGLIGCFPLDNEVKGKTPRETAELIYRANIDLINSAQAIIADISPFRGPNMDPGTAWEIGYGIAKGLPVFAWTTDYTHLHERTLRFEGKSLPGNADQNGWLIENFELIENLMIAISAVSIHDTEDAAIAACVVAITKSDS
jgi:nucleoside 2-deoxyribosyltransferase